MTTKNRRLLRVLALCLALCLCLSFAGCNPRQQQEKGPDAEYCVEIKSQGGTGIQGITVYFYADQTMSDLVAVSKTDAAGKASFTYTAGDSYVAVLTGVPKGYIVEDYYPLTGENTQIVLPIELVGGYLETASYKLGDIMQDFSFTAADGTTYKLSELLKSKKAVMLNFWYLACDPCRAEFPYLQEAYAQYADSVEVLAMNPADQDNDAIAAYAQELGLEFPMGSCENLWEMAMHIQGYPTSVIIDRFGTIALIHSGSIPDAQVFKDIFAFFTAEDYVQTTVENVEQLATTEPEPGGENNPIEIGGKLSFQLTIEPGKTQHVNIHKVSNVWMQVNHKDIYVEYGNKTFTASGGSLGLMVSAPSTFEPARLIFGNSGTETVTVTVNMSNLPGTYDNPYQLQMGEFSTSISSGNDQGVNFIYQAAEDGYLKLQCLGTSPAVDYDFSMYNLQSNIYRILSSDGQAEQTGENALTVPMNQGEKVRIVIMTLPDDANNYPAATFNMAASFTEGEVEDVVEEEKLRYAVTVTDGNRNPLAGVNVSLEHEESKATLTTDENGIATAELAKGEYAATVIVPSGYSATTTKFDLTPEAPYASVKLDEIIIEYADYVVRVIDEEQNPVAGAMVTIGTNFGQTDEDGAYSIRLEKGDYAVVVTPPEGYSLENGSFTFPEDSTVLGVTVKKGAEVTGIEYTVELVNKRELPVSGVLVTFYSADQPVVGATVDAAGKAVVRLEEGDYTVKLTASNGSKLVYSETETALSAEKTSTVIHVSVDLTGAATETEWWGNYYKVYAGSTNLNLRDNANYYEDLGAWMYVFYPTVSGIYEFTISGGGVLGYYGGISFPNGPSLSTDCQEAMFTQTILDGQFANENQPALVIGVVSDNPGRRPTISIVRTGDAPEDLPVNIYEPKEPPVRFRTTETGTLTYVDLEGTAQLQKKSDGYYLNGKKLYINLSNGAPYITLSAMLGINYDATTDSWNLGSMGTGLKGMIYDENGEAVSVEEFTTCGREFCSASDPKTGLYPLTEDLIYIFQCAGRYMGWWNPASPNYQFESLTDINLDIAWMFAVCYFS